METYQRTEKAYNVAHKDEMHRYYHPEWVGLTIYAETAKKAIQKYWRDVVKEYEYKLIDIRAKRIVGADCYLFEGKSMIMGDIERTLAYRAWLEKMKKMIESNPNSKVYIWSGRHGAFWRANRRGYTDDKKNAGIYDINDAWDAVSHVGIDKQISFIILTSEVLSESN